jgi:hypothetical protein
LRLLGKEVPDGGGGMAHGDCFVQGKALAPILGGQDVIARTLTYRKYRCWLEKLSMGAVDF